MDTNTIENIEPVGSAEGVGNDRPTTPTDTVEKELGIGAEGHGEGSVGRPDGGGTDDGSTANGDTSNRHTGRKHDYATQRRNAERGYISRQQTRLARRIEELERKLAEVENGNGSQYEAQSLRDRIEDLQSANTDREYSAYIEDARSQLGDNLMPKFEEHLQKYGNHINSHEPELLAISNRPLGKVVLYEWCKRMDDPKLRNEWMSFTPYEKSKILLNFKSQVDEIVRNGGQPRQGSPTQRPSTNAPTPQSGRNGDGAPADDDVLGNYNAAMRRRANRVS